MADITDQELVKRILAGEVEYFADLVSRYQESIAKFIYFNVGRSTDVEDLTQETFLRAYKYLASYKQKHSLKNWLLAIAANLCRGWYRKRIFTVPLKHIFTLPSEENVAETALHNHAAAEIKNMLSTLPAKEASVLTLHYINELTLKEVASALGIPAGTVKSRLNRGLNRLRAQAKTTRGGKHDGRQIDQTV